MSEWMPPAFDEDPVFEAEMQRLFAPASALHAPPDLLAALQTAIAAEARESAALRIDGRRILKIVLASIAAMGLSLLVYGTVQHWLVADAPLRAFEGWFPLIQQRWARSLGLSPTLFLQLVKLLPGLVPLALAPLLVGWAARDGG